MPNAHSLDFIVIGAQKCGTTTLFEHLRHHPGLELPPGKEAPFFSDQAKFERGLDWYMSTFFPSADPSVLCGTVTPHYLAGGLLGPLDTTATQIDARPQRTVPTRIHHLCPDVRLIALLRDPVQRAYSHYRHARLGGWEGRSFEEAVEGLLRPETIASARAAPSEGQGYVAWSEYARLLAPYIEIFGRDRILILFTRDLEADPITLLDSIYSFVGVECAPPPPSVGKRFREGAVERRHQHLDLHRLEAGVTRSSRARKLWHALPMPAQRRIRELSMRSAVRLDLWNRQRDDNEPGISVQDEARLRAHFAEDTERLRDLIGVNPPWAN